jgi:four helix bundle protein
MSLEHLEVYNLSVQLANDVWELAGKWNSFEKNTIGKQICRSADSIPANTAEGRAGTFIKRINSFVISRGVQSLKPKTGCKD